jgi:hypothetical protein
MIRNSGKNKMIIDKGSLFLQLKPQEAFEEVNLNGDTNTTPVNESPKRYATMIIETTSTSISAAQG